MGPLLPRRMTLVFYYVFNSALTLVLVLHCYWFLLILRIVAKQIASGGEVDDVRSGEPQPLLQARRQGKERLAPGPCCSLIAYLGWEAGSE